MRERERERERSYDYISLGQIRKELEKQIYFLWFEGLIVDKAYYFFHSILLLIGTIYHSNMLNNTFSLF
jgi:hypothetical protein